MDNNKTGSSNIPFIAFSLNGESTVILKQFVTSHGWAEGVVHSGDIDTAVEFMKTNTSPKVLFVDINSQEKISASLDALADVCDPSIKVIISGKVNEYSFYCWLIEVGVSSYLLQPFTLNALEAAYIKACEVPVPHTPVAAESTKKAKIITVIGARGGVGATTICVNIAWILANRLQQKTALLDFDPQLGTVALSLDMEPGRGLREALEKPDRIDSLFLDRVMVRVDDYLSILSTEENLAETITASESAAEVLFKLCRQKFQYIIIDLPRVLSPFTRYALNHADQVLCVTEYSIPALRESLRYLEYCRDTLKVKPPVFLANRVGLAGKHQMTQEEFEKGLGAKIMFNVPFVLDAHAAATSGDVLAETAQNAPATKVLTALSEYFAEMQIKAQPKNALGGLLSFFKKDK
jgi:pilus assembly protein CpaE